MNALIQELDAWLKQHRQKYYASLNTGATEAEIVSFRSQLGIAVPDDFAALYRWRNGQMDDCSESLEHNRMFMSLAAILETKQLLDDMIETDFEDPAWWNRDWIPFLSNGAGDYFCLDVSGESESEQIICFWHDNPRRVKQFTNIHHWLNSLVSSMKSGTYKVS